MTGKTEWLHVLCAKPTGSAGICFVRGNQERNSLSDVRILLTARQVLAVSLSVEENTFLGRIFSVRGVRCCNVCKFFVYSELCWNRQQLVLRCSCFGVSPLRLYLQ
jgi:hypothetical protein